MQEIALISRKIYTAGTYFTLPLVMTVATNLNPVENIDNELRSDHGWIVLFFPQSLCALCEAGIM